MGAASVPGDIELLWIPLGAGERIVRRSGRIYEGLAATVQRRPRCDLYHSALVVGSPDGRFVIEMAPIVDSHGTRRGVVAEGPVGTRLVSRLRVFRYEIRRWNDGVIPDANAAVSIEKIAADTASACRLLALVPSVPTPVWGRDELDAGEMWNSNSIVSWLLVRSGFDVASIRLPAGGRAPGWDAGITVARRDLD